MARLDARPSRAMLVTVALLILLAQAQSAVAQTPVATATTMHGTVYVDGNDNGIRDAGESGLAGIAVSNGREIVRSDAQGRYAIAVQSGDVVFAIKPPNHRFGRRSDGLPAFWTAYAPQASPKLEYGGLQPQQTLDFDVALQPAPVDAGAELPVLVFGDPQPKSVVDVDYYARDIVQPLAGRVQAALGLSLGDIVHDDLSLYPAMNRITASLGIPWLHAAGNHDLDVDADHDAQSLDSFRNVYGPDTLAWEEAQASVLVLDNVIHQPGQRPAYIGGFREDQFRFLEAYLRQARRDRLLVLAMHIPLFESDGRDTFRDADRERLFALLQPFAHVLLLTAHTHTQQHVFHTADSGWHGVAPLHEYNVGAACGAFWSGVKDAQGIPDSTMADGTPNGYARLHVASDGQYRLSWHAARDSSQDILRVHAPQVLRRGAYPAWGVYANVFMGSADTHVEFRVDDGDWKPMRRVEQPDPWLLAENGRDDAATRLRGYDRSPEATPSPHLWRGALPTDLPIGPHRVDVRVQDRWLGERNAKTHYRLEDAQP